MQDLRRIAERRAARPKNKPVGSSFETEHQRAKKAVVKQIEELSGNGILSRAGYSFFSEISLSGLIARNGYPYYNAVANILRQENGGDLTYFIEYYLVLLEEAVRERRRRKEIEVEGTIEAETELARTVITTQAPQLTEDPDWPPEPGGGSADTVGDRLAADGFEVVEAEEEKDPTAVWNDGTSWAGEARLRSELEAMVKEGNSVSRGRPADRPSLVTRLAESLLICLDIVQEIVDISPDLSDRYHITLKGDYPHGKQFNYQRNS